MLILNIIACAICFHLIGGWLPKLPRVFPIAVISTLIVLQHQQTGDLIAFIWLFYCMRLLPTNALLSAINGQFPTRKDGIWQWMQDAARIGDPNGYRFGMTYGFFRAVPALPTVLYFLNPWMLIVPFQGFIYYFAGWLARKFPRLNAILIAECTMGAILGGFIS